MRTACEIKKKKHTHTLKLFGDKSLKSAKTDYEIFKKLWNLLSCRVVNSITRPADDDNIPPINIFPQTHFFSLGLILSNMVSLLLLQ